MDFENISDELKQKAAKCKTTEELMALAEESGIELSDEQLDAISGGDYWCPSRHCNPLVDCIGVEPICDDKG